MVSLAALSASRVEIGNEGGLSPLVKLVRTGKYAQKRYAACALSELAKNKANRVAIVKTGGIEALVNLLASGATWQAENAVAVLGQLADCETAIRRIVDCGAVPALIIVIHVNTAATNDFAIKFLNKLGCTPDIKAAIDLAGGYEAIRYAERRRRDKESNGYGFW